MCTNNFVPGFRHRVIAEAIAITALAIYGAIDLLIHISLFLIHALSMPVNHNWWY